MLFSLFKYIDPGTLAQVLELEGFFAKTPVVKYILPYSEYLEMVESWIEEASRADQQSEFESEFESEEHQGEAPLQPPRNNHAGSGDLHRTCISVGCVDARESSMAARMAHGG